MTKGNIPQGIQNLTDALKDSHYPIQNLREDCYYRYNGTGDPFSKTFIFRVLEDRFDDYLILINESFETQLEKSFEFIDAVDAGIIEYLGNQEVVEFDIRKVYE